MAYAITQQTHEIGIRLALGRNRGMFCSLFCDEECVWRSGRHVRCGSRIGSYTIDTGLLYDVSATDPFTFSCV